MTTPRQVSQGDHGAHSSPHKRARGGPTPFVGINQYADARIRNLSFARRDAECLADIFRDPSLGDPRGNVSLLLDGDAALATSSAPSAPTCAAPPRPTTWSASSSPATAPPTPIPALAPTTDWRSTSSPTTPTSTTCSPRRCRCRTWSASSAASRRDRSSSSSTRATAGERNFCDALDPDPRLPREAGRWWGGTAGADIVSAQRGLAGGCRIRWRTRAVFALPAARVRGEADPDGDGLVSLDELYDYLQRNVSDHARRIGGSMSPIRTGSVQGRSSSPPTPARRSARPMRSPRRGRG